MSETGYRCPKCGQTEAFDASVVILMGCTHITADGWNYYDFPNDVMLDDGAVLTCCECGHEDIPGHFYDEEEA